MRRCTFMTVFLSLVLAMAACKADVLVGERRFDAAAVDADADADDDEEREADTDAEER